MPKRKQTTDDLIHEIECELSKMDREWDEQMKAADAAFNLGMKKIIGGDYGE